MRAKWARGHVLVAAVAFSTALTLAACGSDEPEVNDQSGSVSGLTDTGGPTVPAADCTG